MAPHAVDLIGVAAGSSPRPTLVNTSATFLNGCSVLDGDDGIVTYRQQSIDPVAGRRAD